SKMPAAASSSLQTAKPPASTARTTSHTSHGSLSPSSTPKKGRAKSSSPHLSTPRTSYTSPKKARISAGTAANNSSSPLPTSASEASYCNPVPSQRPTIKSLKKSLAIP